MYQGKLKMKRIHNKMSSTRTEHADLPHNIIPPEENVIEQPSDINKNENKKDTCQCLCRKHRYSFR